MLRFSTALFVARGLSNSDELGSKYFQTIPYEYLSSSNQYICQVNNNRLENISIMIMIKAKRKIIRVNCPPMAYRAAICGFRNQRSSGIVSLIVRCTEHSHASKSSGSPIKVTNIKIKFIS